MIDYEKLWRQEKARADLLEEQLASFLSNKTSLVNRHSLPVKMTPAQFTIFSELLSVPAARVVSYEIIIAAMESLPGHYSDQQTQLMRTHIANLRRLLRPSEIEIHNDYGRGYYVTEGDKRKWEELVRGK